MKNYKGNSAYNMVFIFIMTIVFYSCDSKKEPYQLPDNAVELLTNNTSKTWKLAKRINNGHRMNMGDCFLSYRITYSANYSVKDNNAEHNDCGPSMKTQWKFVTNKNASFIKWSSESLKELMKTEKPYKYFTLVSISKNELIVKYEHQQFSNRKLIITDYLVPEYVEVEGRDFHNK